MHSSVLSGTGADGDSMSMISKEDNISSVATITNTAAISSEDSSSPNESELELGLGLSLRGAVGFKNQ